MAKVIAYIEAAQRYSKAIAAGVGAGIIAAQAVLPGDQIWENKYVTAALALLTVLGVYRVPNKPAA